MQGSDKWVTLWELNKMRRNEPEKISTLWYDQFELDCSVFNRMAGPPGMALCYLLDHPVAVRSLLLLSLAVAAVVLNDPIHFVVIRILSSAAFWKQVRTCRALLGFPCSLARSHFIDRSIHPSIHPSVHPSIRPSIRSLRIIKFTTLVFGVVSHRACTAAR